LFPRKADADAPKEIRTAKVTWNIFDSIRLKMRYCEGYGLQQLRSLQRRSNSSVPVPIVQTAIICFQIFRDSICVKADLKNVIEDCQMPDARGSYNILYELILFVKVN
jgi:hypothetical protein